MKLILYLFLIAHTCLAQTTPGSTVISFTDKSLDKRLTVITSISDFKLPDTLNLDQLLKSLAIANEQRAMVLSQIQENQSSGADTLNLVGNLDQEIQIISIPLVENDKSNLKSNDLSLSENNDLEENQGNRSEAEESLLRGRFFSKSDFGFYIGMTNFTNAKPSAPLSEYELRAWNSFYIALSFRKNSTLYRGDNLDLALSYGPEIAWSNFTFQNSNAAFYKDGQVSFEYAGVPTKKSKLMMPYLNLPIMLNLGFKQERFLMGLGGYMGYRIGGRTKIKNTSGGKVKTKSSFGLSDFIYGLTTEIGRKNGLKFFFRYDLHDLFKSNQENAKGLGAFSAGLRI